MKIVNNVNEEYRKELTGEFSNWNKQLKLMIEDLTIEISMEESIDRIIRPF